MRVSVLMQLAMLSLSARTAADEPLVSFGCRR